MVLRITCPCGQSLQVPLEAAGRSVICPVCRKSFVAPAAKATGVKAIPHAGSAGLKYPVCPSCELPLKPQAKICVKCGFDLRTGKSFKPSIELPGDDRGAGSYSPPPWAGGRIPVSAEPEPESTEAVEVRFGQKWLLIAGLAVLVLGIGYFLKYAFDRDWIGPGVRVALAYLAGMLCVGGGEILRRRQFTMFGQYLIGGGIAILYFSGYAAFQIYALVNQPIAFGLMILVTVLAGGLALFYHTQWLAVLGLIGGFVTPVILDIGIDRQIALMFYMTILNTGVLVLAMFKRWNLLSYLAFGCTWLLFLGWYLEFYAASKFWITTAFLNLFFLTYAFMPFLYARLRRAQFRLIDFAVTIPNAFIALGFSFMMIRECYPLRAVSVVTIAYAAIFAGMAVYLYCTARENLAPTVLLLAKSFLFLIITVPLLFSRHWITIFWIVQAAVLLWAAVRIKSQRLRQVGAALLLLGTIKFVVHDYPGVFQFRILDPSWALVLAYRDGFKSLLLERWITTAVVLGGLYWSSRMLKEAESHAETWERDLRGFVRGVVVVLLFFALNIEIAGYFFDYAARARPAAISALWAIFAAGMTTVGFLRSRRGLRYCSFALFGATTVKVFVWDMSDFSTPYRIMSFLILGLMLIGASYLYHRFKGRILPESR